MTGQTLRGWGCPGSLPACVGKCPVPMGLSISHSAFKARISPPRAAQLWSPPPGPAWGDRCRAGREGQTEALCGSGIRPGQEPGPGGSPPHVGSPAGRPGFLGWGERGLASQGGRNQASVSCPLCQHPTRSARAEAGPARGGSSESLFSPTLGFWAEKG